ncbi:MAG: cell division protein ZapA [Bacteroidales bacterium]
MEEELSIKVSISNRDYKIKINRDDSQSEQTLRQAAQMLNDITNQFKNLGLKNKDEQDYLAMASLNVAVQALDAQHQNDLTPVLEDLRDLNFTMSSYLSEA